jgi:hypothetical protein
MIRFVSTFDRGAAVPLPPGGGGSAVPLRPVDPPGVVGPRGLANGQRPSRARERARPLVSGAVPSSGQRLRLRKCAESHAGARPRPGSVKMGVAFVVSSVVPSCVDQLRAGRHRHVLLLEGAWRRLAVACFASLVVGWLLLHLLVL